MALRICCRRQPFHACSRCLNNSARAAAALAHLVCVAVEGLDGLVRAEPANVDALVGRARGEALIGLPVNVQRRGRMEGELLLVLARLRVPDDGGAINAWKIICHAKVWSSETSTLKKS